MQSLWEVGWNAEAGNDGPILLWLLLFQYRNINACRPHLEKRPVEPMAEGVGCPRGIGYSPPSPPCCSATRNTDTHTHQRRQQKESKNTGETHDDDDDNDKNDDDKKKERERERKKPPLEAFIFSFTEELAGQATCRHRKFHRREHLLWMEQPIGMKSHKPTTTQHHQPTRLRKRKEGNKRKPYRRANTAQTTDKCVGAT